MLTASRSPVPLIDIFVESHVVPFNSRIKLPAMTLHCGVCNDITPLRRPTSESLEHTFWHPSVLQMMPRMLRCHLQTSTPAGDDRPLFVLRERTYQVRSQCPTPSFQSRCRLAHQNVLLKRQESADGHSRTLMLCGSIAES